ncbi:MAG: hypothetical protein JWM41_2869 [Gemmatimonadetes bacterium]|nr:hypothetical protein [Gemmatimonadota bacterium]
MTPEQITEHRAFLAKITAYYRATVIRMIDPRYLGAITYELDGLERSARQEGEFAERCPLPDDVESAPPLERDPNG